MNQDNRKRDKNKSTLANTVNNTEVDVSNSSGNSRQISGNNMQQAEYCQYELLFCNSCRIRSPERTKESVKDLITD